MMNMDEPRKECTMGKVCLKRWYLAHRYCLGQLFSKYRRYSTDSVRARQSRKHWVSLCPRCLMCDSFSLSILSPQRLDSEKVSSVSRNYDQAQGTVLEGGFNMADRSWALHSHSRDDQGHGQFQTISADPRRETSKHIDRQKWLWGFWANTAARPTHTCEDAAALQVEVPMATLMPGPQRVMKEMTMFEDLLPSVLKALDPR